MLGLAMTIDSAPSAPGAAVEDGDHALARAAGLGDAKAFEAL